MYKYFTNYLFTTTIQPYFYKPPPFLGAMFEMNEGNYRCGITFLSRNGPLGEEGRLLLVSNAIQMHYSQEKERKVKTDTFEGRIYTDFKHQTLSCFGGQRFDARIETNDGKVDLAFLVCDLTDRHKAYQASLN